MNDQIMLILFESEAPQHYILEINVLQIIILSCAISFSHRKPWEYEQQTRLSHQLTRHVTHVFESMI
jgi:hypothetical protein